MREPGRHHRLGGSERLGEHARAHLIARVVGKQDHVRAAGQGQQRPRVLVRRLEVNPFGDAQRAGQRSQPVTVAFSVSHLDLRVYLPGNDICRGRPAAAEPGERRDAVLHALPRPQQTPGDDSRTRHAGQSRAGEVRLRAVRDDRDLTRIGTVPGDQPLPSRPGLHHNLRRCRHQESDNLPLRPARLPRHRVQHDDQRPLDPGDQVKDLAAARPAEQPELMLQQDHVEGRHRLQGHPPRAAIADHPRAGDLRVRRTLPGIDQAHHLAPPPRSWRGYRGPQVVREGGQAARGRRVRAHQRQRPRTCRRHRNSVLSS